MSHQTPTYVISTKRKFLRVAAVVVDGAPQPARYVPGYMVRINAWPKLRFSATAAQIYEEEDCTGAQGGVPWVLTERLSGYEVSRGKVFPTPAAAVEEFLRFVNHRYVSKADMIQKILFYSGLE